MSHALLSALESDKKQAPSATLPAPAEAAELAPVAEATNHLGEKALEGVAANEQPQAATEPQPTAAAPAPEQTLAPAVTAPEEGGDPTVHPTAYMS